MKSQGSCLTYRFHIFRKSLFIAEKNILESLLETGMFATEGNRYKQILVN